MSQNSYRSPRETMLAIEGFNALAEATDRLRRAAFGLDHLDRIEIAERISAKHSPTRQRQGRAPKSRRAAGTI
jgi:hypothetical protein